MAGKSPKRPTKRTTKKSTSDRTAKQKPVTFVVVVAGKVAYKAKGINEAMAFVAGRRAGVICSVLSGKHDELDAA